MIINTEKFFGGYRAVFGKLSQPQVNGLSFILNKLDNDEKITGETWEIVKAKYSYVLSTIQWETALTYEPITERGTLAYLKRKKYFPFIGRGYVQLTWKWNYQAFGDALGIDLVNNPTLANDPEIAWQILSEGMTDRNLTFNDPEFTAYSLEDFFNEKVIDFVNARKIINGKDQQYTIAKIAEKFNQIIEFE